MRGSQMQVCLRLSCFFCFCSYCSCERIISANGLVFVGFQVSPDQAQLLAMLVQILGANRCIEVGVYTVCVPCVSSISHTSLLMLLKFTRETIIPLK